ncbi:acyl-ACP--UDP-N-acetylglucosamine O-acyltransferase [Methylocystis sp. MJC1]|jgi:UDP-N-acetylglucosamine acyltransferase|uniref:acyl-ACP--UDP-N-acetylglucosamine O-acyltransferase n=1 Tax=Methylocystis sp. MJC1 TaxID=2654282 RepID=UPI0013ED74AA|nr:acyl-ACP--UDP-N-acetylglucosamine O-acyltransferase [Methylocystis sp. MJC1]KAF2990950.1 Acyl-[acyl-carrier-protein]--UDP-N-acetylglucosamine O-acyltransferase [Methylocystis sp. MJC1]MBU6527841.1 acyl-ACP--UDP-N-acetylglucosamine O-acyltransferase [Methylocystis sp. MJC1]UZX10766.1 acyl-ACP--UDP-N-acetylglucosamine O-acyltransferase [Methylocystis sp. MJC1]
MTAIIHPTAILESGARLHDDVVIGPFCHIAAGVEIGAGAVLQSHVAVAGRTKIGARARVFPFVSLGAPSQDLKAALAEGDLSIGDDCIIREGVTINSGVGAGTRIGAGCAFLAYSHVAHDCRLGDGVILANQALLGGHVTVGDHASIGGGTAVHQNVRIGAHAFVGGLAGVEGDVIPFGLASGNRAHLFGVNVVGLRRRGFSAERIAQLRQVYRRLFAGDDTLGTLSERVDEVATAYAVSDDVGEIVAFLRASSQRPLCAPRQRVERA